MIEGIKRTKAARSFGRAASAYFEEIGRIPQLTHAELVALFERLEKTGDSSIKNKLIASNLRLVISIANQYRNFNLPMEDLIQEGNLGLMKSIERFDWRKGYKFSTYATWWVRQAITQHITKSRRTIRIPAHAVSLKKKMANAADEYRRLFGTDATTEELTEILGASETVVKATMLCNGNILSLDAEPPGANGEQGHTLHDTIADPDDLGNPFDNVSIKQLLGITKNVMSTLSVKEAAILRLRFGLVEDIEDTGYEIDDDQLTKISQGEGLNDDTY